jgi:hypothetical protein
MSKNHDIDTIIHMEDESRLLPLCHPTKNALSPPNQMKPLAQRIPDYLLKVALPNRGDYEKPQRYLVTIADQSIRGRLAAKLRYAIAILLLQISPL